MNGLRVLIVNRCLLGRSGTEMYVRDLARELLRRNHRPAIYSPQLGPTAEELRDEGLFVTDDLDAFKDAPDVLHAHHTWETMAAVARFPAVPAIFVGHDVTAWHDTPPRLPSIRRYVAVDHALHGRLTRSPGIDAARVCVVPNPIDFDRFSRRGPLPAAPKRALQFSSYSGPRERAEIEAACRARGIELDSVGRRFGNATSQPENLLADYDLVFAKGRCALEAAAVGAAVVFCDTWGCGPLLTSHRLDEWGGMIAGRNVLSEPLKRDVILRQIDGYDAEDAAIVSAEIRNTYGAANVVNRLERLYAAAIDEADQFSSETTARAVAAELGWWSVHCETNIRRHLDATARLAPDDVPQSVPAASDSCVDFAHPFRGGGWYPPECDERGSYAWLGPEPWAWLDLTVPQHERLLLRLEIASALRPPKFGELELRLDGERVDWKMQSNPESIELVAPVPRPLRSRLSSVVQVMLLVPQTQRPCDVDPASDDPRRLAIALRRIALEGVAGPTNSRHANTPAHAATP